MTWTNEFQTLKSLYDEIYKRLTRLESSQRFTLPNVSSDPSNPRKGDAWLNTTTNQAKIVDATGAVRVITWS